MYESGFAAWFEKNEANKMREDPYEVLKMLALHIRDPADIKTIVMGMKAFDLETLAMKKCYLSFPSHIPIMVDSRVTDVSLSTGIVSVDSSEPVSIAASKYRSEIISAWSQVIDIARDTVGKELNALRLDSLIWHGQKYPNPDALSSYLQETIGGIPSQAILEIVNQFFFKNS